MTALHETTRYFQLLLEKLFHCTVDHDKFCFIDHHEARAANAFLLSVRAASMTLVTEQIDKLTREEPLELLKHLLQFVAEVERLRQRAVEL
jgi:hypothetical protein